MLHMCDAVISVVIIAGCSFLATMCSCTESTGRYLLIALLLSTITMLSQTAFQLYGFYKAGGSTLAPCESLLFQTYLCIWQSNLVQDAEK